MSAYDVMREVMEDARIDDECDYYVYSQMFDLIGDADEENAKLRELLCELYEDQCDECDRWKYRDRMRKLGIEEVD